MFSRTAAGYVLQTPLEALHNGVLWSALHVSTGQRCSLRVLDKEAPRIEVVAARFVEKLMGLDHPNLAKLYSCFFHDHYLWVASECPDIGQCAALTAERGSGLGEHVSAAIMRHVADALAYLHSHSWVHRDVGAHNVLLFASGHAKLTLAGGTAITMADTNSNLVGSPVHLAPELVLGSEFSDKCDVWALGVTVLELLAGAPPLKGVTPPVKVALLIAQGEPLDAHPALLNVSPAFALVVRSCLARDPLARPTAAALVAMLATLPGFGDIAAVPALQQRALPYDPNTLPPFVYPVPPLVEPALQRAQISAALAPQGKPGVAPSPKLAHAPPQAQPPVTQQPSPKQPTLAEMHARLQQPPLQSAPPPPQQQQQQPSPQQPTLADMHARQSGRAGAGGVAVSANSTAFQMSDSLPMATTAAAATLAGAGASKKGTSQTMAKQPSFSSHTQTGKFTIKTTTRSMELEDGAGGGGANGVGDGKPVDKLDALLVETREATRMLRDLIAANKSDAEIKALKDELRVLKLENESLAMENTIFRKKLQQLGINPTSILASMNDSGPKE